MMGFIREILLNGCSKFPLISIPMGYRPLFSPGTAELLFPLMQEQHFQFDCMREGSDFNCFRVVVHVFLSLRRSVVHGVKHVEN